MRGEISRYQPSELSVPEPEYIEQPEKEHGLTRALEQVRELYTGALNLPAETRGIMERLCLAQQTILEEQLHARHPEQHPEENQAGRQYRHRDEALLHLQRAMRELETRDIRTIDISAGE